MAGIDKTYVNKEQAFQIIEWCKSIGEQTLENGYKFNPIDFVLLMYSLDLPNFGYREDDTSYCLWNTPTWFDRWLWLNCPFEFIKNRIKEQYSEDYLNKFESFQYSPQSANPHFGKQHYSFLEEPKWYGHKYFMNHGNYDNSRAFYEVIVEFPNHAYGNSYDKTTDSWGHNVFEMLPYEDNYVWNDYHKKSPTKKSIIRQLRKWYLPKGTVVKLVNWRYEALDYKILIK